MSCIINKLDKTSEVANTDGEKKIKPTSSFKDDLTKALEGGVLEPEEAKMLLERMESEKEEAITYTKRSAKILVDSFDVKGTDTWIKKSSLKEKLREISNSVKTKTEVSIGNTVENSKGKEKVIATDIFNRTLRLGSKGSDVMVLQEFLIKNGNLKSAYKNKNGEEMNNANGIFNSGTESALKEFQKSIGYNSPDGILNVSKTKTYKTLATIKSLNKVNDYKGSFTNIYARKSNLSEVKESIKTASIKVDALKKLNENSDDFYKALESYIDGGDRDQFFSDMGSILGWGEELVGNNEANEYFTKYLDNLDKLNNDENKEKFNNQLEKLLPKKENKDGDKYSTRGESLSSYGARDLILVLVFQDIPLFDVRFNFAKNLVSHGVPMDKALALKNWVIGGMKGEPDYSEANLAEISGKDALASLGKLRSTLTAYGFSNKQIDSTLKGDLKLLSNKQKQLLLTIIEDRIIPDLETLRIGGFNFIERWFDDKDNKIENILNKLAGRKHTLDIKAQRKFNKNIENYDVTLQKLGDNYILEVDDYGSDTYKIFNHYPNDSEIQNSINSYNLGDEQSYKNGWNEPSSVSKVFDDGGSNKTFSLLKLDNGAYIIKEYDKFKYFDHKPTQKEIDNADENFDLLENTNKGDLDKNLTLKETFSNIGEVLSLLKEQDTEDGFYGSEPGLTEGIKNTEERTSYAEGINDEFIFANRAIKTLELKDSLLFKKFSMLGVFDSPEDFLKAFPTNENIHNKVLILKNAKNEDEYAKILIELNKDKNVSEYFDIVFNAHENNKGMQAWKDYRTNNISRYTGLKKINLSPKRRFKYGESLPITATGEDALLKMKSETTDKGGMIPSKNILGNIVSGIINKAGITDVTVSDLELSINKKWEAIPINQFNDNVINTAVTRKFSNDHITTLSKLMTEKGDTHVFHTEINKEFILYKKSGEKIVLNKSYNIYLRPECNNLIIIPGSNNQLESLKQGDFNMDISSLNTPTLPITLNLLKSALDSLTNDGSNPVAGSEPIDDNVINIPPVIPGQPLL